MMQENEEQKAYIAEALMFFVVQAEHRTWWRCQSRRDKNEYQTAAIICLSAADRTGTHVTSIIHSLLYTPFSFICYWLVVEFSFSCVYLLNLSWMSFVSFSPILFSVFFYYFYNQISFLLTSTFFFFLFISCFLVFPFCLFIIIVFFLLIHTVISYPFLSFSRQ